MKLLNIYNKEIDLSYNLKTFFFVSFHVSYSDISINQLIKEEILKREIGDF